jgi:hypothetical protein
VGSSPTWTIHFLAFAKKLPFNIPIIDGPVNNFLRFNLLFIAFYSAASDLHDFRVANHGDYFQQFSAQ